MIVVYEQFGIAFNLGADTWTTIRKVNVVDPDNKEIVKQYCLAFDYGSPGHPMPYPEETERDAHWDKIIAILRQRVNATGIVGATKIPTMQEIMNPNVERR